QIGAVIDTDIFRTGCLDTVFEIVAIGIGPAALNGDEGFFVRQETLVDGGSYDETFHVAAIVIA
ncbi:hypothetical protein KJ766_01210, partial [Patescibacteria group bacterium]|nr:hypothetical protein [Patescibacteria group bacterium]